MSNIIDQLELELAAPADESGLDRAERNTEPEWQELALKAIDTLAQTGEPFDAFSVSVLGVPPPDHHNRWGALFRRAKRDGTIRKIGYRESARPGRAHGVCAVWIGAEHERKTT